MEVLVLVRSTLALSLVASLGVGGCVGAPMPDDASQVVAEVQVIPAGVGCLRVVYRLPGATADTTRNFAVTPGTAATLDFGALAAGSYSFRANAFSVACGSVANSTVPTWVGDPVAATIVPGIAARIAFTLRPNVTTTSTVDFVQPVRAIYSGPASNSTYAVMQDGTVRAWGLNNRGQLGTGNTATSSLPLVVVGLTNPTHLGASSDYACAATPGGLACWGWYGGVLADDGPGSSQVPRFNPDVEPNAVVLGYSTLCGVFGTTLRCWSGIESLEGPFADASAVTVSPSLWRWGDRTLAFVTPSGALLRATFNDPTSSEHVAARTLAAAASDTTLCRLRVDGGVSCRTLTGYDGAFGPESSLPIRDVTALHAGMDHFCALLADRTVRCWGNDTFGQLGARSEGDSSAVPLEVALTDVTQLATGDSHSCALRGDGSVWCWGANAHGQLGDGTRIARFAPTRVRF